MQLDVPTAAPHVDLADIYGNPVRLGQGGTRTLLCFFRDAACPFCNFRLYLLTHRYPELKKYGLDVVAVFASTREEVLRFAARHERPFTVIADPESKAYAAYGIERSLWKKFKAVCTRMPTLLRGLRIVGLAGLNTNNVVPADFLVDADGRIVEAYYAMDAGDHIPWERVELFVVRGMMQRNERARGMLASSRAEAVAQTCATG